MHDLNDRLIEGQDQLQNDITQKRKEQIRLQNQTMTAVVDSEATFNTFINVVTLKLNVNLSKKPSPSQFFGKSFCAVLQVMNGICRSSNVTGAPREPTDLCLRSIPGAIGFTTRNQRQNLNTLLFLSSKPLPVMQGRTDTIILQQNLRLEASHDRHCGNEIVSGLEKLWLQKYDKKKAQDFLQIFTFRTAIGQI